MQAQWGNCAGLLRSAAPERILLECKSMLGSAALLLAHSPSSLLSRLNLLRQDANEFFSDWIAALQQKDFV